jgi:hypothetical protein
VVVEGGLATALPEAGTEPPPGSMVIDVAPETLQLTMELPPALMLVGLAVKARIIGGEDGGDEKGVGEDGGGENGDGEDGGGENGDGEDGGGENGVGEGVGVGVAAAVVTATVTDLLTLPAELVAVMV